MIQFLIGACAGAAVALLYAPMTGKTARAKLRDKATKCQHKVGDLGHMIESKKQHVSNQLLGIEHKMSEFGDKATEKAAILREKASELKKTVDELTSEFGVAAGEIADEVGGTISSVAKKASSLRHEAADELSGTMASVAKKASNLKEEAAKKLEDFAPSGGSKSSTDLTADAESSPTSSEATVTPASPKVSQMPGAHKSSAPSQMPGTKEPLQGKQPSPQNPGPNQDWTTREYGTGA